MAKAVKREPKKPYEKPMLTVYGTVREMTHNRGTIGKYDSGRHTARTHV